MELALGTAQFGLAYGIAGRDIPVSEPEVRRILEVACERGVRLLDTAAGYGDIESRLARLIDGLPLRVVSKLPPRPAWLDGAALSDWAAQQVAQAYERLGAALVTLLFHRAEDLLEPGAEALWYGAAKATRASGLELGVSAYDPDTVAAVHALFPLALAQLPGNAFDRRAQRARFTDPNRTLPLHLRSVFLQGLLMPADTAARRLPAASAALTNWHRWCNARGLSALEGALACIKGHAATHAVVGVDGVAQFQQIADAWAHVEALDAPELAVEDPRVVDPRTW